MILHTGGTLDLMYLVFRLLLYYSVLFMKKYVLFVSHSYSYSILRPIQTEVLKRGGDVAWFVEKGCPLYLKNGEKLLNTIYDVIDYNPIAVFAPGNYIYDFFPGIKVEVFHGFDINKRPGKGDHYSIKGWFDLYCTQGENDTRHFVELSEKYQFFKVAQTGWAKFDSFPPISDTPQPPVKAKPVILYTSTFTRWITSAPYLYDEIHQLIRKNDYTWIITFHPKMDKKTVDRYKWLTRYDNVSFYEGDDHTLLLQTADVMVCDSSSIIIEFLYLNKPVVTYRNTSPGDQLVNIETPELLENAIVRALQYPPRLMNDIDLFIRRIHPFRDRQASARILDAVDNFIENDKGRIKKKPLNLFRKLKMRFKVGYFPFGRK